MKIETGSFLNDEDLRKPVRLSYYLAAFIDILGQSDDLQNISAFPKSKEEAASVFSTIHKAGLTIKALRHAFKNVVQASTPSIADLIQLSTPPTPEELERVPPRYRAALMRLHSPRLVQRGFSDTFLLTLPLFTDGDPASTVIAVSDIEAALMGIANLSLSSLAAGIPLRGGVEIGLGFDLFPNEVYDPVLVSAHNLESRVAEYPRTVVGPNLLSFLTDIERLSQDDPFGQMAVQGAGICRSLICKSPDDGRAMVHMASMVTQDTDASFPDRWAGASAWVNGQANRYRAEGNEKLAPRYARLAAYFDFYTTKSTV